MQSISTPHVTHPAFSADQPYLHLLEGVEFTPIFVLGFARSGTTLLYELLTKTKAFNFFNFYHTSQYPELLSNHLNDRESQVYDDFNRYLESLGIRDRGFDGITINANAPMEYGLLHNVDSLIPLQIWTMLKSLFQSGQTAPLFSQYSSTPKTLTLFIQACKKLQFISGNQYPLLLKNPWDFPNFIYLKQCFPLAKFVFIHRHPVYVLNSQLKALSELFLEKNPYVSTFSPVYNDLYTQPIILALMRNLLLSPLFAQARVSILSSLRSQVATYYLENIASLPPADYISLRYEDLCTRPDQTRAMVLQFLGLDLPGSWHETIQPRAQSLLPELEQRSDFIREKFQSYLTSLNYE